MLHPSNRFEHPTSPTLHNPQAHLILRHSGQSNVFTPATNDTLERQVASSMLGSLKKQCRRSAGGQRSHFFGAKASSTQAAKCQPAGQILANTARETGRCTELPNCQTYASCSKLQQLPPIHAAVPLNSPLCTLVLVKQLPCRCCHLCSSPTPLSPHAMIWLAPVMPAAHSGCNDESVLSLGCHCDRPG